MMLRNFFMLAACASPMAAGIACADTSPIPAADYKVAKSWRLGGNGGWDYLALEDSSGRLFVTREERVDVIETVSGKLAGSIPRTAGVHAVAFAPAMKRGFTSNGRTNTLSVFELDTLRVIQEVPVSGTGERAFPLRAYAAATLFSALPLEFSFRGIVRLLQLRHSLEELYYLSLSYHCPTTLSASSMVKIGNA